MTLTHLLTNKAQESQLMKPILHTQLTETTNLRNLLLTTPTH